MKRSSVAAGVLLGFFSVHLLVALVRAEALVDAWGYGLGSLSASELAAPWSPRLPPVPPNDAPMSAEQLWDHLTPAEQLNAGVFAGARSVTDLNNIRLAMAREAHNRRQILAGSVPPVVGMMVAAIADPVVLLVGALAGWWFFRIVRGMLRTLVVGVAAAAVGNGVAQLVLQITQYTRSTEETIAVEVYVAGALIIAVSVNWLVSRYGGYFLRPLFVITRGPWVLICKSWRALETQADETGRR